MGGQVAGRYKGTRVVRGCARAVGMTVDGILAASTLAAAAEAAWGGVWGRGPGRGRGDWEGWVLDTCACVPNCTLAGLVVLGVLKVGPRGAS